MLLALALALAAGAPAVSSAVYAVTRIGSDLADDQVVGTRRAGMMCLPAGTLRWSDVATGSGMDQREVVQDVIEDAGVAVTPLGESTSAGGDRHVLRLRGVVRAARFDLCARRWLGDKKALSGETALTIEWRAESRAAAASELKHVSTITRPVDARHAAPAAALYRALLRDAARDLARWLNDRDPPER